VIITSDTEMLGKGTFQLHTNQNNLIDDTVRSTVPVILVLFMNVTPVCQPAVRQIQSELT